MLSGPGYIRQEGAAALKLAEICISTVVVQSVFGTISNCRPQKTRERT
jgi:hypothetical protein